MHKDLICAHGDLIETVTSGQEQEGTTNVFCKIIKGILKTLARRVEIQNKRCVEY